MRFVCLPALIRRYARACIVIRFRAISLLLGFHESPARVFFFEHGGDKYANKATALLRLCKDLLKMKLGDEYLALSRAHGIASDDV